MGAVFAATHRNGRLGATADGTAFLVMELVEGETLAEAVAARPAKSAASSLAYARP